MSHIPTYMGLITQAPPSGRKDAGPVATAPGVGMGLQARFSRAFAAGKELRPA